MSEHKNYITPGGLDRLTAELRELRKEERPKVVETISWAAGNGDRSENADYTYGKKRLREIDRRIRFLTKRIENAELVNPVLLSGTEVRFSATVTILDEEDRSRTYSIVGTDEVNIEKGHISWRSPMARALLRKNEGDVVTVHMPRGDEDVEIVSVVYATIP